MNHVQKFTSTTTITDYHCLSENDFSNIVYDVVQEEKDVEIQNDDDCGMDHCFLFTWTNHLVYIQIIQKQNLD